MLPDFPKLKGRLRLLVNQLLRQSFAQQAPVISEVRRFVAHEGNSFTVYRLDGTRTTSTYQETAAELRIDKRELPTLKPQELIAKINTVAAKMAEQSERRLFEELREAAAQVGNIVDARGERISAEPLFQLLERLPLDFDEAGRPHGLTMVVGPELAEALKALIPQWESDPEFQRKHRAIMEKKREEWRVRESRRKLVE